MRDGDEVSVVGDDGVDMEPGLDHLQATLTSEMTAEPSPGGLIEDQAFGVTAALGRSEFLQEFDYERGDGALTGGQAADCTAGALLLERLPACRIVLADKGYDRDAIRRQIEAAGAAPNTPPKINRRWKPCFSPVLYRGRNAIGRMFGHLKGFRRIATRHDRLATNYLAAVCLAATVSYCL